MPFSGLFAPVFPSLQGESATASQEGSGSDFAPAIFTLDGEGRFLRVGLRLARLLGVHRAELVGLALSDFIDPDDDEKFADRWFDLLAGGDSLEMATTLVLRDGERRRVRLDLLTVDDGSSGYSGVLTPETGHKGKSAIDFDVSRTLMDTFGMMVLVLDPHGVPIFSNAAIRNRFGRPLGGKDGGFLLVHPEERAGLVAIWNEAISEGKAFTHEIRMAAPDESHRWMRLHSRPHYDDAGRIRFWAATLHDREDEVATQRALEDARRFIVQFGAASPDVMFLFDLGTNGVTYCSEASTRVLGYTPDEMRAMGADLLPTVVHPDDWNWISVELARAIENEGETPNEHPTIEYRARRKDGKTIWVSTRSLVFERDAEGRPRVHLGITQDITERKQTDLEREDHMRILEHALSGVAVLDGEGRYLYANVEHTEIVGRSASDLIGRHWADCVHGGDVPRMESEYERMLWTGRVEVECRGIRPDGTTYHQHVVMIPKYVGETFSGHYRFVRDVTERVRFQHQLETQLAHISSMTAELEMRSSELESANTILAQQAGSDGLTGLANHRVLQETLQRLNETGGPHSLLLLDVDHFKAYNDAFGHPAGDLVLREFARVLTEMTAANELAARYGGEEFALVLPDVDLEGAEARASLILQRLAGTSWPHRAITASVGCSIWSPGRGRAELIETADRALYISKRNGRNRVTAAA